MTQRCPVCHEPGLPERSRFCLACGTDLMSLADGEPYTPAHLTRDVLTSQSAREGERKEVTVLFADLQGSLAIAESLDPEDVHAIMDEFFGLALDVVHRHGGTINQFRGDGFMALFGAPRARGEDAAAALRAALEIREAALQHDRSVEARFGIPFLLRMGAHTGTVWVGSIGTDLRTDYTAEGRTVGLAARLEHEATPGQILVSEDTARRIGALFELRDLGPRSFRGVSEPIGVFELLAEGPFEGRFDAERARGLAPFFAREFELERLDVCTLAAARGQLQIVSVTGEVGIGKSRLLLEHLAKQDPGTPVLEVRCREADRTQAYTPWLELLRRWPAAMAGAEQAASLSSEFGGDPSQVGGTREDFGRRLGRLFDGVHGQRPLLIALEDVHWLDPPSREVLEQLSSSAANACVLLMTTARSELLRADALPHTERIELGPLDEDEAGSLARAILRDVDDSQALVELAVGRGGGNPLFVEETARALREGPEPVRRSARLEIELRQSEHRVPETLTGVIAARIDGLEDSAKRVLQAGAVVGRPFDSSLLESMEPQTRPAQQRLEELLERGLLMRDRGSEFDFRHVLVRDVAYDGILLERQRNLHGRCGEALVLRRLSVTPDGASRIGAHFDRAQQPAEALEFLSAAGRAYLKLHAPLEAAAHLKRCWELHEKDDLGTPRERASLALALASALNSLDRAKEAAAILDALDRDQLEHADQKRLALAYVEGGWVRFSEENDVSGARELIGRGRELAAQLEDQARVEMPALAYLSRLLTMDGDMQEAIASASELVSLARTSQDSFLVVLGLSTAGGAQCDRGNVTDGLKLCCLAGEEAEASSNEIAIGFAQVYLAQASIFAGEPVRALEIAELARATSQRSDQVGTLYQSLGWAAEAHLLLGDLRAAAAKFEQLATINNRWPSTPLRRARGHLALGEFGPAAEFAQDCLAMKPPRIVLARALTALGHALGSVEPGNPHALDPLREAIALCAKLGLAPHEAEARLALSAVLARSGRLSDAERERARAMGIYRECGMERYSELISACGLFRTVSN